MSTGKLAEAEEASSSQHDQALAAEARSASLEEQLREVQKHAELPLASRPTMLILTRFWVQLEATHDATVAAMTEQQKTAAAREGTAPLMQDNGLKTACRRVASSCQLS